MFRKTCNFISSISHAFPKTCSVIHRRNVNTKAFVLHKYISSKSDRKIKICKYIYSVCMMKILPTEKIKTWFGKKSSLNFPPKYMYIILRPYKYIVYTRIHIPCLTWPILLKATSNQIVYILFCQLRIHTVGVVWRRGVASDYVSIQNIITVHLKSTHITYICVRI